MVGRLTLDQEVGVRIPAPQPQGRPRFLPTARSRVSDPPVCDEQDTRTSGRRSSRGSTEPTHSSARSPSGLDNSCDTSRKRTGRELPVEHAAALALRDACGNDELERAVADSGSERWGSRIPALQFSRLLGAPKLY